VVVLGDYSDSTKIEELVVASSILRRASLGSTMPSTSKTRPFARNRVVPPRSALPLPCARPAWTTYPNSRVKQAFPFRQIVMYSEEWNLLARGRTSTTARPLLEILLLLAVSGSSPRNLSVAGKPSVDVVEQLDAHGL